MGLSYIFGHIKAFIYSAIGVLIAVLFGVVKYKSHQVESLKAKAIKEKLQIAQKQREQADKTAKALEVAHNDSQKRIERVKADIAARKPISFD